MKILALDAATERCSVALLDGTRLAERSLESGKSHAEHLLRLAEELLAEAGATLSSLDAVAASVGPGAFTGVRVTVSVAQGLAFGAGLPTVAVMSLESLALQALRHAGEHVLACLDARMGEVYWGCFTLTAHGDVRPTCPPAVGAPATVSPPAGVAHAGIGRGFAAHPTLAALAGVSVGPLALSALPRARELAQLGGLRWAAGLATDPAELQPVYLRDKVAFTEAERAARS